MHKFIFKDFFLLLFAPLTNILLYIQCLFNLIQTDIMIQVGGGVW